MLSTPISLFLILYPFLTPLNVFIFGKSRKCQIIASKKSHDPKKLPQQAFCGERQKGRWDSEDGGVVTRDLAG